MVSSPLTCYTDVIYLVIINIRDNYNIDLCGFILLLSFYGEY